MDIKTSLKKEASAEKAKLKNMSWQDRIWYIWEYYKFHILALLIALGLVITFFNVLYRQTFTTRLSIAIVNDRSGGMNSMDTFETSLRTELGYGKKDLMEINEGLYAAFDGAAMSQYAYASLAKISALVASNSLDIMIADTGVIEHYGSMSGFIDLKEFLPEELYQKVEEYLLYAPDEQGVSKPVALSLKDTSFAEQTGVMVEPAYLAVIKSAPHTEDTLRTIEYLFR